jgi:hypothetical protein
MRINILVQYHCLLRGVGIRSCVGVFFLLKHGSARMRVLIHFSVEHEDKRENHCILVNMRLFVIAFFVTKTFSIKN